METKTVIERRAIGSINWEVVAHPKQDKESIQRCFNIMFSKELGSKFPGELRIVEVSRTIKTGLIEKELIESAWQLYCEETAGDMDVKDFWTQLPKNVQKLYIDKIIERNKTCIYQKDIPPEEIKINLWNSSKVRSKRGNWVNVPDYGIELIHIPTGTVIHFEKFSSPHANKAEALKILKESLSKY